ncbi:hypothetical protein P7C73_g6874, partial [Tremellales sp. Uapishka_1]
MISSTTALALLLLPLSLGFSDRNVHEQSRQLARSRAHIRRNPFAGLNAEALAKRDSYSGRATFFDVGLGACGNTNVASDFIVAQNTAQFASSQYPAPNCGKSITISYNGKTATATIEDECPTCDYGSLDMSRGLFDHFASEDLGEFQMTWWYNDGSSEATTTSQTPTSTYVAPTSTYVAPTSTYTPPTSTYVAPTSTYTPPTSTSTYVAPTSTYTPPASTSSSTTDSTSATALSTSSSDAVSASASLSVSLSSSLNATS